MKLWLNFSIGAPSREVSWLGLGRDIIAALREAQVEHTPVQYRPRQSQIELIWRRASSLEEHDSTWIPHRIVRWTPRSILVEAHPWLPDVNPDRQFHSGRLRTYWLNRWDLEHKGVARVRSRKIVFFKTPRVRSEIVDGIESLLRLGLWFPFTEEDLRKIFLRRAHESHPDAGGNDERFLRLQNDRDNAATLLARLSNESRPSPEGDQD
jgi:hypothetical protein